MMRLDRERCGLRMLTEIVINRNGVNYDDVLLARTCRSCRRLMLGGTSTAIPENSGFRIILKAPEGVPSVLRGTELLSVTCSCGASYNIVVYGPSYYNGAGIVAYTIIQLDGLEEKLSDTLEGMRRNRERPADLDCWLFEALAEEFNNAVKAVNEKGVMLVEEDWAESKYSTGWIEE